MFSAGGKSAVTSGYNINNSLRLRSSASGHLSRTPSVAGNRKTWTWSGWYKKSNSNTQYLFSGGTTAATDGRVNVAIINDKLAVDSFNVGSYSTTALLRDSSAWYHIVVAFDTTQATSSNRIKLYINGIQQTIADTTFTPTLNADYPINSTVGHFIGKDGTTAANIDGYLAEVNFIGGQALTPSSFGETDTTTGVWKPKAYSGTYGTNGFYLKFSDIATTSGSNAGLGKDFSGNGNFWTTNNISVTAGATYDAMTDSPTLTSATVANYCVLNPLYGTPVPVNGNLTTAALAFETNYGSLSFTSGKWYFEVTVSAITQSIAGTYSYLGVMDSTFIGTGSTWSTQARAYASDGTKYDGTNTSYGATWTANDVIGVAVDVTAGTIVFYKNNTSQGTAFTDLAGKEWRPLIYGGTSGTFAVNFGQRPFTYTPPTGFNRINTYNLPDSTIIKGNRYMEATTYTGTGASLSVTNAGSFRPDFVWMKGRSGATDHAVYDSVRGTTKDIVSNSTSAETTEAQGLTAFNSNGFTVGTLAKLNTNTATYVGWQWRAGEGTTASNTNGTIPSTVSVNATAGFSIATYAGTGVAGTIGHGLGVAPKMIIIKNRTVINHWRVFFTSLDGTLDFMYLSLTDAKSDAALSLPTSTVFSVGNAGDVNVSGSNYVAYCWAEIAGFSKFGSYTGNGSNDGPFVYLGFRPKFIMWKLTSSTLQDWGMQDSARIGYNPDNAALFANLGDAEYASNLRYVDFTSNGFKIRNSSSSQNLSSGTYIYMAFAENPFKNALAR